MQCHAHTFFMLTACICFICRSASKGFSTSTASRCEPTVARDCLQRPGPCICIYIGYVKPLDSCMHAFFMRECMHPSALSLASAECGRRHREYAQMHRICSAGAFEQDPKSKPLQVDMSDNTNIANVNAWPTVSGSSVVGKIKIRSSGYAETSQHAPDMHLQPASLPP